MKRLPKLARSAHSIYFAIIAGFVVQILALIPCGLLLWAASVYHTGEASFWSLQWPWMFILAAFSVGPQVTLVLRQGDWKQKLGTVFLYAALSIPVFYLLCAGIAVCCGLVALALGAF